MDSNIIDLFQFAFLLKQFTITVIFSFRAELVDGYQLHNRLRSFRLLPTPYHLLPEAARHRPNSQF